MLANILPRSSVTGVALVNGTRALRMVFSSWNIRFLAELLLCA